MHGHHRYGSFHESFLVAVQANLDQQRPWHVALDLWARHGIEKPDMPSKDTSNRSHRVLLLHAEPSELEIRRITDNLLYHCLCDLFNYRIRDVHLDRRRHNTRDRT